MAVGTNTGGVSEGMLKFDRILENPYHHEAKLQRKPKKVWGTLNSHGGKSLVVLGLNFCYQVTAKSCRCVVWRVWLAVV